MNFKKYLLKFLVALFLFIYVPSFSQSVRTILPSDYNKDSLTKIYGKNKKFIPEFELPTLIALSFYPELKDARITFKLANKESVAKTTITFFSVLRSSNKHFIIYVNKKKARTGLLLSDLPFNAQIGVFGHELGHVASFIQKDLTGITWWGIRYLSKKYRIGIERRTDVATIKHGLGWQLYDFIDFVLYKSFAIETYKILKRKNYLSPQEILKLINE